MLRPRNASGFGEVTVTVLAASSASAFAPAGTYRPVTLDPFFGFAT